MMKATDVDNVYEQTADDPTPQWRGDGSWAVGFYFGDEAEQLNGPYKTKEEASAAFDEYCRLYL